MQERQTKQKTIIYEGLKTLNHPTATEVYEWVHERAPQISRATVFRVLGGFAESGKALELKMAGSDTRYDFFTERHCHAHCRKCGKVEDVWLCSAIPKVQAKEVENFTVEDFTIEFTGVCKDCKRDKIN